MTAIEYLGPVGIGATAPQMFNAIDHNDNDAVKTYIVKFANNRLGAKVLVNELLALRFGKLIDICFPSGGIINIPKELVVNNRRLLIAGFTSGLHFGSRFLRGTQYLCRQNLHLAQNKSQMAGVILFDHMFYNLDRTLNRKNLLIRKEKTGYKIYAIDNSHLFRRGRWNVDWLNELKDGLTINHRRSFGLLLKHYLYPEDFISYVEAIKDISDEEIDEIINSIPQKWLPDFEERVGLKEFIVKRIDMVDEIAYSLIELIPDVHGSSDPD
ncbi:hypothetical protein LJC10_01690 [Selenomonadales bacterium OttesenSCG-928-I06]|nr:hypothetical protein [Selenomonadales bacterium OttesenSCG-928-I06]